MVEGDEENEEFSRSLSLFLFLSHFPSFFPLEKREQRKQDALFFTRFFLSLSKMASFARTSSHSCFMTVATTSGKAAAPLPARRGTMVAQAVAAPRRKTSAMRKGVSTSSAATTTTTASPSSSSSSSTSSSAGGAASVRSNVVSATSLHASGPQPRLFAQEVLAGTVMGFWEMREGNQGKKTRGPRRSSRWRRPVFSRKRHRTSAFYRIAPQS